MIELLFAAALAAQGDHSSGRHDHGLAFFQLSVNRYLPGRETVFELYEVGEGEARTLLVERRIEELGGESRHDLTVRECSNMGAVLEELPRMQVPPLYIEGISPPVRAGFDLGTVYEFRGFVEHPNGEMGEISLTSNDPGGAPSDPLRDWADGLMSVFEACLET